MMQGGAIERLTPWVKHFQIGQHYQITVFWIHTKQNEATPFMTNIIQLYAQLGILNTLECMSLGASEGNYIRDSSMRTLDLGLFRIFWKGLG